MDKATMAKLFWGLMLIGSCLGLWSIAKAVVNGEISNASRSSSTRRTIRRDQNPQLFFLYVIGFSIVNVAFFLGVVIWGIVLFW
jgi:F0F1-type ATP synthase membrane subunit c/vacuolar-type H+-ATPase subunit K